jgi:hypothetical protein
MQVSSLLMSDARVTDLADLVRDRVADQPLVAVSGAKYVDLDRDQNRLTAALATATDSAKAGVPHLFMVDVESHPSAFDQLREAGGIVAPLAAGEGGLARPYLAGAQIINLLVQQGVLPNEVPMVKVEAEKNLFGSRDSLDDYLRACRDYDVVSGVRTNASWESMPSMLALTESVLGYAIGHTLGISTDTPSGVLVLSANGRRALLRNTTEDSWTYLIEVPFQGLRLGLAVGELPVTFDYHPAVVDEENGSDGLDQKRRGQFDTMFGYAVNLAHREDIEVPDEVVMMAERFQIALPGIMSAGVLAA